MRAVTIRNVPEEVHRAIRVRAAQNGRTLQAEMCEILATAVKPEGRVKLGDLLAAMTVAELRAGVALMPASKRRTVLSDSIEHQVLPIFVGRVLSFDMACTRAYADVLAAAREAGSGIDAADAIIAAIALDNGFSVATRNVTPFLAAGVKIINPWEDQQ